MNRTGETSSMTIHDFLPFDKCKLICLNGFLVLLPSKIRILFPVRAKRPNGAFITNVTGQTMKLTIVNHFRQASAGLSDQNEG